jgi:hypothetical protein
MPILDHVQQRLWRMRRLCWIIPVVLIVGNEACRQESDLKALEEKVDMFLLEDGTLSREAGAAPKLSGAAYAAAHKKIETLATPRLREIVRDPSNANVVDFLDLTFRKFLKTDGIHMQSGEEPASGRISLDQYLQAVVRFADQASPALITLLRDPVRAVQADAMIRGHSGDR